MDLDFHLKKLLLLKVEVKDLPQLCKLDPEFERLCSSKIFWKEKYQHHGLLLLDEFPNIEYYIRDFRVCQKIMDKVNKLVQMMFQITTDPQGFQFFNTLSVYVNNIEDFDIPEINLDELREIIFENREAFISDWEAQIERYLDHPVSTDEVIAERISLVAVLGYSHKNDKHKSYVVNFYNNDLTGDYEYYEYFLSVNSMKTILYTLLYRGNQLLPYREEF